MKTNLIKSPNFRPPYRLAVLKKRFKEVNGKSKIDLHKRWYIEYYAFSEDTNDLTRKTVYISSSQFPSAKERIAYANAIIKQLNEELIEGGYIGSLINKGDLKLKDAIEGYITYKTKVVKRIEDISNLLQGMFYDYCRNKYKGITISQLRKDHILAFLNDMQHERKWQNATRNKKRTIIRSFFQYYVENDTIEFNPVSSIKKEKENKGIKYLPFVGEEITRIKEKVKTYDEQLYLFCQFIYFTFGRPLEVLQLRVGDIDFKSSTIRFRSEISKNQKTMHVQLSKSFVNLLLQYGINEYPDQVYVFGNKYLPSDTHYNDKYFTKNFRKFLTKNGYSDSYSLYSWKHTGVCALYKQTQDIELCRRQCRHSSILVTQIYLRDLGMMQDDKMVDFE